MAYTTGYSLVRFDPTLGILYVSVDILNDALSVVETINSFPIKLPINSSGEVPEGTALTAHVEKVISRVFSSAVLAEKKSLFDAGGVVVNAAAIYALTNESEIGETTVPTIVGYVFDTLGAPINAATITSSLGETATSDANGAFIFDATAGAQKVSVEHPAYFSTFKMTTVVGLTHVVFTLQNSADILTSVEFTDTTAGVNIATGTARASNNAEVEIPASGVVDEFGTPVANAVLDFGNIVVSDPGSVDVFPGYFLGDPGTGSVPIQTYGYINLNLRTPSGDPLFLDSGIGATIRLPVDPDPVGVDSIDTWKLNETTGVWEQTGTATRVTGTNVFEFNVTSFSWHNLDAPLTSPLTLTIRAWDTTYFSVEVPTDGTPAAGVEVTVNVDDFYSAYYDPAFAWQGRGVTDSTGTLTLSAPAGFLRVIGKKGSKVYNGYGYQDDGLGGASVNISYTLPEEDGSVYVYPITPIYVLLTPDPDFVTGNVATRSVMQVIDSRQTSSFSGQFGIDNGNVVASNGLSLVQTTGETEQAGPFAITDVNDGMTLPAWVTTTFPGAIFDPGLPGFIGEYYYITHAPITINTTATAVFSY